MTNIPDRGGDATDLLHRSASINRAIETLREAGVPAILLRQLDAWNGRRLMAGAVLVESDADLAALFEGISPEILARAGIA